MFAWLSTEIGDAIRKNPREYLDAIKLPCTADSYFEIAVAEQTLGQHSRAEKALRMALQKDLRHLPSLYALALKEFQKSQERIAKNLFRRALRLDSKASESAPRFQKELKTSISCYETACRLGVWCLKELEFLGKETAESKFFLGKTLFEQSRLEEAVSYLYEALKEPEFSQEASEYLSYIYEHLYKGDELITKTLLLAKDVKNRSDLFFNLAMVCQHEERRSDIAMHFFYLAFQEDPQDPGLRFSLEQAALEVIGKANKKLSPMDSKFLLMFAHLYQGSMGMAKRYAMSLKENISYPETFKTYQPVDLWNDWLLKDEGLLGQSLRQWFGSPSDKVHRLSLPAKAGL